MKQHNDTKCQVCGCGFDDSHPVFCLRCGIPHHEDCWRYVGQCSVFGCGGRRCAKQLPDDFFGAKQSTLPPSHDSARSDLPDDHIPNRMVLKYLPPAQERNRFTRGPSWQAPKISESLEGSPESKNMYPELTEAKPETSMISRSARIDDILLHRAFQVPFTRMDMETTVESLLSWSGFTFIGFGTLAYGFFTYSRFGLFGKAILVLGLIILFVRMFVDCTYVLDNEKRLIVYSASVFGFSSDWVISRFDDVSAVYVLNTEDTYGRPSFQIVLRLSSGAVLPITHPHQNGSAVNGFAVNLAYHLGVDTAVRTGEIALFENEVQDISVVPWEGEWREWPVFGRPSVGDILTFIVGLLLMGAVF